MKAILLCLVPIISFANPIDDQCNQFVFKGAPISDHGSIFLCKTNFAIHYNEQLKNANYVVEHVTKQSINTNVIRKNNFNEDNSLPEMYQASLSDYHIEGIDRGHLSPAGDNTSSSQSMSESFLLSNIIPQDSHNNRGIWNKLETNIRNYVNAKNELYVVTGTYYTSIRFIGNNVAVPTHLYKVIVDPLFKTGIAFLIPNRNVPATSLPGYAMSIAELENVTNINFMPHLSKTDQWQLENKISNLNAFAK
jgi:endonuclease G